MKISAVEAQANALSKKWGARPTGPQCGVARSPHRELIEALSRRLASARVSEVLFAEKKIDISTNSVARHKRGDCRCRKV